MPAIPRRRFVQILAAIGATSLCAIRESAAAGYGVRKWEGEALGADASIVLAGFERRRAGELFRIGLAEIRRLEAIFSLYDRRSALSRLNAAGSLTDPPGDLLGLLSTCREVFEATGKAFDPTIQPLWRLFAETYGGVNWQTAPSASEIAAKRDLIGFDMVSFDRERIAFERPGMAMTLNGIAQGYIADCVTGLLRASGVTHALVNLGEYRAIGNRPDARPWQVGIQDPRTASAVIDVLDLVDQAVSTSGAYGGRFGENIGVHHLIDPRTGVSPDRYLSVSVRHPSATLADGLSTGFSCLSETSIAAAMRRFGRMSAVLVRTEGTLVRL